MGRARGAVTGPGTDAAAGRDGRRDDACSNARPDGEDGASGDPTELALLASAARLGERLDLARRDQNRAAQFRFDPRQKLMSTVDRSGDLLRVHAKGAPEAVLPQCATIEDADGSVQPLGPDTRRELAEVVNTYAASGLRVLAFAKRDLASCAAPPRHREDAERGRFGPARSYLLSLLRSRCHGIADRFQVLSFAAGNRARIRP